jgi:5-formyltetrahydrofolate cyclo-ligase
MKKLRNTINQQRLALTAEQKTRYSLAISEKLFPLPIFKNSKNIACYLTHKNEVDTQTIIETIWRENKLCYLPIINPDQTLNFVLYTPENKLITNKFGILEPDLMHAKQIAISDLELVITPLVAFNSAHFRIGWGLGHYDRTFSFLLKKIRPTKPYLLGLAYNFQLDENIKIESWDVPLDLVITEKEVY